MYVCIYIYIERERYSYTYIYIYIACVYIALHTRQRGVQWLAGTGGATGRTDQIKMSV